VDSPLPSSILTPTHCYFLVFWPLFILAFLHTKHFEDTLSFLLPDLSLLFNMFFTCPRCAPMSSSTFIFFIVGSSGFSPPQPPLLPYRLPCPSHLSPPPDVPRVFRRRHANSLSPFTPSRLFSSPLFSGASLNARLSFMLSRCVFRESLF